ncbi:MAG: ATP-binding protein [Planctomycetota bacterium]|nr:ATP-binding protein [Planctomycetota bacterium]
MQDPLRWLSVRYKLALMYVGLNLVAFGVGGFLISRSARSALEDEILRRLEYQCRTYATALDSTLDLLTRRTEDFASDGYIRDHLGQLLVVSDGERAEHLERELHRHLAANKLPIVGAFNDLAVVDLEGRVVVAVHDARSSQINALARAATMESGLWYSGLLSPTAESVTPTIVIGTPLLDIESGEVIGKLLTHVRLGVWIGNALRRSRSETPEELPDVRLSLHDGAGLGLEVPTGYAPGSGPPEASEPLRIGLGLHINAGSAPSVPGRRRLVATGGMFMRSFPIQSNGWMVEVGMRSDRALLPLSGLQSRFLGMGLILAALSTLLLYFPMRFLARPLVMMKDAAQALREGDYSTQVAVESSDEIGDLAESFNHMAQAVKERTVRLETSATELRREQDRTRAERDRLDTVISSMKDGLIVLDREGEVVISNEAAEPLLRAVGEEGIDARGHHVCAEASRGDCGDDSRGGEGARPGNCLNCLFSVDGPGRSCMVDLGPRTFEVHSTPLARDARGRAGMILVARDITDRVAQDERQIHQERLAVMGEIAAVMAHELNNPLASISMFNQMLGSALPDESPLRENVDVISRNTETCKQTIRELLDYATGATPESGAVDIHGTLEDVIRFLRPICERAGVSVMLEPDAETALVTGDEVQLRQVFVNLVMNAVQAMEDGGSVVLSTALSGDHLLVDAIDTGGGIDPEAQGDIFRPFYTTKRRSAGTGLGLPTSRRIAELHGGGLELVRSDATGSHFRVRLRARTMEA